MRHHNINLSAGGGKYKEMPMWDSGGTCSRAGTWALRATSDDSVWRRRCWPPRKSAWSSDSPASRARTWAGWQRPDCGRARRPASPPSPRPEEGRRGTDANRRNPLPAQIQWISGLCFDKPGCFNITQTKITGTRCILFKTHTDDFHLFLTYRNVSFHICFIQPFQDNDIDFNFMMVDAHVIV